MNKQLSVMGLAARASMIPALMACGVTAMAVGVLVYMAQSGGVGAASLAGGAGFLAVMAMLCLGGCGFGSRTSYTIRRLRLREELVDLWWAAYHAIMLLVLWALVAAAALLGMQLKLQGLEPSWGVGPQSLMLLTYGSPFLHHLLPLADAAVWVTDAALLAANALAAALFARGQRRGQLHLWPLLTVGVTMFTFTVDVADNAWMAMLLTALALMGWMLELLLTGGEDREE